MILVVVVDQLAGVVQQVLKAAVRGEQIQSLKAKMVEGDQRVERETDEVGHVTTPAASLLLRPTANLPEPQMAEIARRLGALLREIEFTGLVINASKQITFC